MHGKDNRTSGQKAADFLTKWAGSWTFILLLFAALFVWMAVNTYMVFFGKWDPYPFILLNLMLSCLAAMQAPVILMSQNRQMEMDRKRVQQDYYVNRKAEKEIKLIQRELLEIKSALLKQPQHEEMQELNEEIKLIQEELSSVEQKIEKASKIQPRKTN